jgi:23S rRNA (pseudouridine1915-N3)-methyltransferase
MKIELWVVGKTSFKYIDDGVEVYLKRLKNYIPFQILVFSDIKNAKNMSAEELKKKEGELMLSKLSTDDFLVLMDENGVSYSSVDFANYLEKQMNQSRKRMIFVVGGAFGFSKDVYERANHQVSLSKMTFSHQMIRLFFVEQLYRAMTILKNEPYHNQ